MSEHYYYAVGRVRSLEAMLLSEAQLSRMISASDFESAFAVLSETVYAESLSKLKSPFDLEELCQLEFTGLKKLVQNLSLNNETIKVFLKEGKIPKPYPSPLLQGLANHQTDLANIKTVLRCLELNRDKNYFLEQIKETGLLDKDLLVGIFNSKAADIISKLNFTVYAPEINPGLDYYLKHKSFYLLEKLMDDFIINKFHQAKYLGSGLEPLVGFYLAKASEIKTIRFILICKSNQVKSDKIKERIRIGY